tara:strand:- start:874 stop:2199 length:1326 start_codon:yes stop_codon:yes gene_type:complete
MDITYLKESIKENEIQQKKDKKQNYLSDSLLQVVEAFMKKHKRICYGGTAINSILPKEKQFYNYDIDIPDYDFFSPTALEDAKNLCNLFKKENVFHIEGKNAIFFGTYKVFVNFVPIADITQIHETFYNSLLEKAVSVQGILYTPPSYLRMSLHQELARPKGDVSRWEKIYERMQLLNEYFPLLVKPLSKRNHMYIKIKTKEFNQCYESLYQSFRKQKNVFCNFHIIGCIYKKYLKHNYCNDETKDKFIIYCDDLDKTIKTIKALKHLHVKIKKQESIYKFIGNYAHMTYKDVSIGYLFQTNSCLSFIEVKHNHEDIQVGNIDTLLNLYFSLLLMNIDEINNAFILSIVAELNAIVEKYTNVLEKKKKVPVELQRFKLPCIGDQEDLPKILKNRQRKFNELKHDKRSVEYKKWFFKYSPNLLKKTQKGKTKNKKRKTKKKN